AIAAIVLLFVIPPEAELPPERPTFATAPTPTPTPTPQPQPQPPRPLTVVWNFETDPPGAAVTIEQASPEVFAALAPQLEGQVTPLRLVVPFDDQARLQVTLARPGS